MGHNKVGYSSFEASTEMGICNNEFGNKNSRISNGFIVIVIIADKMTEMVNSALYTNGITTLECARLLLIMSLGSSIS